MVPRLNLVVGSSDGCCLVKILQESDKGQIFSLSIQTCFRIRRLIDCHHAQKTSKLPYFRLLRPIPKYFLPLLPYTDLVPRSTDPVPPSTN